MLLNTIKTWLNVYMLSYVHSITDLSKQTKLSYSFPVHPRKGDTPIPPLSRDFLKNSFTSLRFFRIADLEKAM